MKIKQLRLMKGLSQKEFASHFGIAQNTLSQYERGVRTPDPSFIKEVASTFRCTSDYLLDADLVEDGDVGENLRNARELRQYSIEKISEGTGIPLEDLEAYEDGEPINLYLLNRICAFYGLSGPADLYRDNEERLNPQEENDESLGFVPPHRTVSIPILGQVVAGEPMEAINNVEGYTEISEQLAKTGEFFALRINGASMEPNIKNGDLVIVKKENDVDSGRVAIVLIAGEEATCKQVQKERNGIMLIGFNQKVYPPHFYTKEDVKNLPIQIIGRVVESRHTW